MNNTQSTPLSGAASNRNLVYNYNFLYFSNKELSNPIRWNHPDGWLYSDEGSGGQISFDEGKNACRIVTSQEDNKTMRFAQHISEFPRWKPALTGQMITAYAYVGNGGQDTLSVNFQLSDGVNSNALNFIIDPGEEKPMQISLNVGPNATLVDLAIISADSNAVIDIYKVFANIGDEAVESLPCMITGVIGQRHQYISTENAPAEEISLCQQAYELPETMTRLSSFLNGTFGRGQGGLSLTPDMRGYFSRAWNNGASIDPTADERTSLGESSVSGDHVSTVEEQAFLEHDHDLSYTVGSVPTGFQAGPTMSLILTPKPDKTDPRGGKETRPTNLFELYTMKWA